MIDFDNILTCFVEVARNGVGSRLALIGPTGAQFPAVIRARQDGVSMPYPYIQLDLMSTAQTSGWKLDEGIDINNKVYIDTTYKLLIRYTVYGGNANSIAHELEAYFRLPHVLQKIYKDTDGKLENTFDVRSSPSRLSTSSLEVASFDLTYNIIDRFTDVNDDIGTYSKITVDGDLLENADDTTPIELTVIVP